MDLIFVDDSLPGITRIRRGKGWSYYCPEGNHIKEKVIVKRLNAIALPPAYTDAWFCPAENGHILATGFDVKGRKQYRYHPEFREQQERSKFEACSVFGHKLPLIRARVLQDLESKPFSYEYTLAAVVRLMDIGSIRVGNDRYTKENKSFGATTLRNRHAKTDGSHVMLSYKAKSGKQREVHFTDKVLAKVIKKLQDLPGQHLFQYKDEEGLSTVGSTEINRYIQNTMGDAFSAKHFRTWAASVLAFEYLMSQPEQRSLKVMLEGVSKELGNTPSIARKSYVHPVLIEACKWSEEEYQTVFKAFDLPRKTQYLSRYERGLLAFLEAHS
jgi:DNA topoisomerase-1